MASFIAKLGVRSVRGLSVAVPKVNGNALVGLKQNMFHTIATTGRSALPIQQLRTPCSSPVYMTNVIRGFKNKSTTRPIKTKKSAAKRIIRTGSGKLKVGHSGKAHLNTKKSRVRLTRLNKRSVLTGTMFKKMNKLLL